MKRTDNPWTGDPVCASIPGQWPDGEPASVRDAEEGKAVEPVNTPKQQDDLDRLWEWLKNHMIEKFGYVRAARILNVMFALIEATGGLPRDEVARVGLELLETGRLEVVTEYLESRQ